MNLLQKIDPKLKENGWGVAADSYILTEVPITRGRISQTVKPRPMKADYILQYKGVKLAVVEVKSDEKPVEHLSKLTRSTTITATSLG